MKLLSQNYYFERHGDAFVLRTNAFSAGYAVTAEEKEHLFARLKRFDVRLLIEGLVLIALVAALLATGVVRTATPLPWFLIMSVAAMALLAVSSIYRKRRLVESVLGRRAADMPRLPLRQALRQPRPLLTKRYALPVLYTNVVLLVLAALVADALAMFPIVAALRARRFADTPADHAAIAEMLSLTLYSVQFWAIVAAINLVFLASAALLAWEARRLRAMPDID